jgi:hypothetical protein
VSEHLYEAKYGSHFAGLIDFQTLPGVFAATAVAYSIFIRALLLVVPTDSDDERDISQSRQRIRQLDIDLLDTQYIRGIAHVLNWQRVPS